LNKIPRGKKGELAHELAPKSSCVHEHVPTIGLAIEMPPSTLSPKSVSRLLLVSLNQIFKSVTLSSMMSKGNY